MVCRLGARLLTACSSQDAAVAGVLQAVDCDAADLLIWQTASSRRAPKKGWTQMTQESYCGHPASRSTMLNMLGP